MRRDTKSARLRFLFTLLAIKVMDKRATESSTIKAGQTGKKISKSLVRFHLKPKKKSLVQLKQDFKKKREKEEEDN